MRETDCLDGEIANLGLLGALLPEELEEEWQLELASYRLLSKVRSCREDLTDLASLVDELATSIYATADAIELANRPLNELLDRPISDWRQDRFERACVGQLIPAGEALERRLVRGSDLERTVTREILRNSPVADLFNQGASTSRKRAQMLRSWAERIRAAVRLFDELAKIQLRRGKPLGRRIEVAQVYLLVWAESRRVGMRELARRLVDAGEYDDVRKLEAQLKNALGRHRKRWPEIKVMK